MEMSSLVIPMVQSQFGEKVIAKLPVFISWQIWYKGIQFSSLPEFPKKKSPPRLSVAPQAGEG